MATHEYEKIITLGTLQTFKTYADELYAKQADLDDVIAAGGEPNTIDVVKVNGTALTPDANKAVDVKVEESTNNGKIKVNGSDVTVHGLGSAAYTASTDYDASGAAAAVLGSTSDGSTAKTVYGAIALANTKTSNVGTITGVAASTPLTGGGNSGSVTVGIQEATSTQNGYMTSTQASKLAGIASGATANAASTTTPKMDGTAAVGTESAYARADHVHPTDTSRQATLVSGTNIKTVNGNSLLGSGDLGITPSNIGAAPTNHTHDYLPLSGGTITGTLKRKNADMDTSAESLSSAKYSIIGFTDANDRYAAYFQAFEFTDGTVGFDVAARRYNNNSDDVTNYVRVKIDKFSNASVDFSHTAAWREGLGVSPVVLFESDTAINEPTLSDSVANYARIRVHVKDNHGVFCGSYEFYGLTAGSVFTVSQEEATANDNTMVRRSRFTVSSDGKTFTPSFGGYYIINHTSKTITSASTNGTNYLRIARVEGYSF